MFAAIFENCDNQSNGCSSSITERGIFSYYGSKFDLDHYKWKNGILPNEYIGKKNCCDDCLENMKDNDIIEYVGEYW
jgi:hypothetical protein